MCCPSAISASFWVLLQLLFVRLPPVDSSYSSSLRELWIQFWVFIAWFSSESGLEGTLFVCFPLWWELAGASQTDLRVSSCCCCCCRRLFVLLRSPSFVVVLGRGFFGVWTLEGVFWLYACILWEWAFPSCSEEKLCLIAKQFQGTWVASHKTFGGSSIVF